VREPRQASLLDVAPTILAWAGVPAAGPLQGTSLLSPLPDRESYGETDHGADKTRKLFVRSNAGGSKAIFTMPLSGEDVATEEWFDLAKDPAETRASPPRTEVAAAVRQRTLERWRANRARGTGAPAVVLTQEQRERLRALGYVTQ
jgi:arylsulfatase A-like enzyme